MTINQILDEQMKEIEEYISIYPDGEESFEEVDIEPEQFRSLFRSFTRKLIESVAEEIIKDEKTKHDGGCACTDCIAVRHANWVMYEQRLKVKEILSNLK